MQILCVRSIWRIVGFLPVVITRMADWLSSIKINSELSPKNAFPCVKGRQPFGPDREVGCYELGLGRAVGDAGLLLGTPRQWEACARTVQVDKDAGSRFRIRLITCEVRITEHPDAKLTNVISYPADKLHVK